MKENNASIINYRSITYLIFFSKYIILVCITMFRTALQ